MKGWEGDDADAFVLCSLNLRRHDVNQPHTDTEDVEEGPEGQKVSGPF